MDSPPYHGLLVLDKPSGITSRDAVNHVQRLLPRGTKLGHAGTLDPLATGVLVVCVGAATRLVEYIQQMDKEYETDITLGARSDTDDADGRITPAPPHEPPPLEQVRQLLDDFTGVIEQTPPAYSAARVAGRRAHTLARRGRRVQLTARPVVIYSIELLSYAYPRLSLRVRCGKGTYIRSLARDLGERLGCGGYVQTLRRTRIGDFTLSDAVPLDRLRRADDLVLLPVTRAVAHLPWVVIDGPAAERLAQGQRVALPAGAAVAAAGSEVAVFRGGELVAVCRQTDDGRLAPEKVLRY